MVIFSVFDSSWNVYFIMNVLELLTLKFEMFIYNKKKKKRNRFETEPNSNFGLILAKNLTELKQTHP